MASLFLIIPLAVVIILNLFFRNVKKLALYVGILLSAAQVLAVLFFEKACQMCPLNVLKDYLVFNLSVDNLSLIMLMSIAIVAFTAFIVAGATMEDEDKLFNLSNLIIIALMGMNGVVMVTDLFSMYVFLEVVAVSSFILIAINKTSDSFEGSFKYLILSAVATILMLTAIALLLMVTGDTSFAVVRAILGSNYMSVISALAICAFAAGLFIKGGLVPFHGWLPDAYTSAPSSVSVFLAGIVTKTTGVYTIIRLFTGVFGFSDAIKSILLVIGAVTIVFGALAAIGQNNFKRMLAYSSISQVGYIILALGTGTALGLAGAIFHLFNHAVFKTQLFVNASAVEKTSGTMDMDKMGGFSAKMPVTGFTSVVGFLSCAGIPPFAGFWSKFVIVLALWNSGNIVYAFIAVIASLITLAYFLSMQRRVFFGKLREGFENLKEAPAGIIFASVLLALVTFLVGVFLPYIINTIILPIDRIM